MRWFAFTPSKKFLIGFGGISLVIIVLTQNSKFLINDSYCLPQRCFIALRAFPAKRGDLVTITGHKTKLYPSNMYTKRLLGVAGDSLVYKGDSLYVNDILVGRVFPTSSNGTALTAIEPGMIPQGYVFVAAPHPRTFDSRYREFGLVPLQCLFGKTWGVF